MTSGARASAEVVVIAEGTVLRCLNNRDEWELRGSNGHVELRFFSTDALPQHLPAVNRRFISAAVR